MEDWVSAASEFHSRVWQAIEDLGTRCYVSDGPVDPQDSCPMCDECTADYSAATRALFAVIYLHRPESEPDIPEGSVMYPLWKVACSGCTEKLYPCPELLEVAEALGVEWNVDQ